MSESNVTILHNHKDCKNFKRSKKRTIIFYTADYCPACKTIEPFYNRLANRYHKKIAFAKADAQECDVLFPYLPTFVASFRADEEHNVEGDNKSNLKDLVRELLKAQ